MNQMLLVEELGIVGRAIDSLLVESSNEAGDNCWCIITVLLQYYLAFTL